MSNFRDYYPNTAPYNPLPPSLGTIVPSEFWASPVIQDPTTKQLSCPGYSGNTFASRIDDFVVIGDYTTPGLVDVSVKKGRKFDLKSGKGTDGANLTTYGIELADVEIRVTIWTPQQLVELRKLWQIVFPGVTKTTTTTTKTFAAPVLTTQFFGTGDSNGNVTGQTIQTPQVASTKPIKTSVNVKRTNTAKPFSVYHPKLDLHQVGSLYFLSGSGPDAGNSKGSRVFTMTCREYLPPNKNVDATSTARGVVPPRGSALDAPTSQLPGAAEGGKP